QLEEPDVAQLGPDLAQVGPSPQPPLAQLAGGVPQLGLLGRQLEVHAGSFGNPRMRSAMMLRWTCDVPPPIVRPSDRSRSPTNAVPRSKENVTMATRQPSFSSPTRLDTGTRTSSKNTSENSELPAAVRMGRTSMPGLSIGTISQVMPLCFGASGFVRTSTS